MIVVGAVLAAIERPESALVWSGAVLVIACALGERLATAEIGREGAKITTREKVERVIETVREAAGESTPTLTTDQSFAATPPAIRVAQPDGSINEYFERGVLAGAATALGSNTRSDFDLSNRELRNRINDRYVVGLRGVDGAHVRTTNTSPGTGSAADQLPRQPDDDF